MKKLVFLLLLVACDKFGPYTKGSHKAWHPMYGKIDCEYRESTYGSISFYNCKVTNILFENKLINIINATNFIEEFPNE